MSIATLAKRHADRIYGATMSDTICGHERESLRWALNLPNHPIRAFGALSFSEAKRRAPTTAHANALSSVHDPEKLAEIIAELIRESPKEDAVVIAPNRSFQRTPSRLDWVMYWDRDHGGTIQVKSPCGPDDPDTSKLLTMQQARAFASKLLDGMTASDIANMIGA